MVFVYVLYTYSSFIMIYTHFYIFPHNDIIINRNTLLPTLLVLSNNSILHCIEIIVCNPKYKALLEKYPDIIIAAKRRLRNYYNCFPDEQKEWLK